MGKEEQCGPDCWSVAGALCADQPVLSLSLWLSVWEKEVDGSEGKAERKGTRIVGDQSE